jgi:hypothetical protein
VEGGIKKAFFKTENARGNLFDPLRDHRVSVGKPYPARLESTLDLAKDLHLQPIGRKLERVCTYLAADLLCEKPADEMRG